MTWLDPNNATMWCMLHMIDSWSCTWRCSLGGSSELAGVFAKASTILEHIRSHSQSCLRPEDPPLLHSSRVDVTTWIWHQCLSDVWDKMRPSKTPSL
jgi:hypothetical protein